VIDPLGGLPVNPGPAVVVGSGLHRESWITKDVLHQPIRLLPRVQEKIARHYPGTKLAITEYYYGGGAHISGAPAQADALGIFGREGVFATALWHEGKTDDRFTYGACRCWHPPPRMGSDPTASGVTACRR